MRLTAGGGAAAALALTLVTAPAARADGPGLLAIGLGAYDVRHGDTEAQFRVEYRFATSFLWIIQPLAGVTTLRAYPAECTLNDISR